MRPFKVLVLEKCFAKFMGSYAALEGGLPLFAMHIITGDECLHWSLVGQTNRWECKNLEPFVRAIDGKTVRKCGLRGTGESITTDDLFTLTCKYVDEKCPLGAGSKGTDNTLTEGRGANSTGIVPGHAYSVLACLEVMGQRLIQLRNPWGRFEWSGEWSKGCDLWEKNPRVKEACNAASPECGKGTFWMPFSKFGEIFDMFDVCVKKIGMGDLKLQARSTPFQPPFLTPFYTRDSNPHFNATLPPGE